MNRNIWGLVLLTLVVGALPACKLPSFSLYTSVNRDFSCDVPWAWNVMTDQEGTTYTNTNFIGPFEPDFYLGVPSFSVRWYARYAAHRLRDGHLELYADMDDYIRQTLDTVYGSQRIMLKPVSEITVAERKGKYFVVFSPAPADPRARWGTAINTRNQQNTNPRQHAYVLLPTPNGFYVLIYPATQSGYKKYEPQFTRLVKTFKLFKNGPGNSASGVSPDEKSVK